MISNNEPIVRHSERVQNVGDYAERNEHFISAESISATAFYVVFYMCGFVVVFLIMHHFSEEERLRKRAIEVTRLRNSEDIETQYKSVSTASETLGRGGLHISADKLK